LLTLMRLFLPLGWIAGGAVLKVSTLSLVVKFKGKKQGAELNSTPCLVRR